MRRADRVHQLAFAGSGVGLEVGNHPQPSPSRIAATKAEEPGHVAARRIEPGATNSGRARPADAPGDRLRACRFGYVPGFGRRG